jgi:hypothetical protein
MFTKDVVVVRGWWFGTLCPGRNNRLCLHAGTVTLIRSFGQRNVVVVLMYPYLLDGILAVACIQSHHQLRDEVCVLGSIAHGRQAWTRSLAFARAGRRVAICRGVI